MKAAEILRQLADLIDQNSEQSQAVPAADLTPVEVDNTDNTETSVMIPPLQQKIELLKKATGVDNHYDQCGCDEEPDELAMIKRHAGINPVVVQVASDDEPLDN
jgi:hypothetical protein